MSLLQNKVAVVSGGTGYLGSCAVKQLAEQGMKIAIIYKNTSYDTVEKLIHSLPGSGHKAYKCDLSNKSDVTTTIETIEQEVGVLYACIHTAGEKPLRKKLYLTTEDDLEKQIHGTIVSSFNLLTLCAKKMKERKDGVIIGITTAGVLLQEATQSLGAYIPAKYAVQGMLVMLQEELRSYNVRVYSVAPGFMSGGMNSDIPQAFVDMIRAKSVTKKITTGEEVAKRIVDMCKEQDVNKDTFTILIAPEYE